MCGSCTYKKGKQLVKAVEDLSFAVQSGEIIGLLGANGSGKTTTIKCISNLLIQDSGEVTLDGKCVNRTDVSAVLEGGAKHLL